MGFISFSENFDIAFPISGAKKRHIISFLHAQVPYLGKRRFLSYKAKYSEPMKLRDSSISYISRKKMVI